MVGRFLRGGFAALAAGFLLVAVGARAQTAVWDGDVNDNFEQAGNYQGDVAPDGSTTVDLPGSGGTINFNAADNAFGLVFQDGGGQWNLNGIGGGSLTLGAGGMGPEDGETEIIAFISVPIALAANQTWNGNTQGFIFESGVVSGAYTLTIQGRVYLTGANTFSGGVTVQDGATFNIGNAGAAGTGAIQVQDGGALNTYSGAYTVANPVSFNNGAMITTDSPADVLTLSGPVTFGDSFSQLNFGDSTAAVFSGAVAGPGEGILTLSGQGAALPVDGGSQLVMTGQLSGVQALNLTNMQLILAPTGNAATALGTLDTSALSLSAAYLGLGGTFANEGQVSSFLSTYGPGLGSSINGTLGLDSIGNSGTFSDPIDLSSFTGGGFLGLGTTTTVTVTGSITPPGDSNYVFGGGGGKMTVESDLGEFSAGTTLTMTAAPAPLTLILQGDVTFTGGVASNGGVLIFDTATGQAAGSMTLSGGYVGYTSNATDISSPATFISRIGGSPTGVIGFDTDNLGVPANITQPIDLSGLNAGANVYLGTATAATLSGLITPTANHRYQLTGVKGGALEVDSILSGTNALEIGLSAPIESNGSVSSVTLGGVNTFSGGTTLNSGILKVLTATGLGTSSVSVPDTGSLTAAPNISASGGPVTLSNAISFGNLDGGNNPGLTLGQPSDSSNLTLSGVLSDQGGAGYLGIQGNATLSGNNTYTGNTIINSTGYPYPSLTLGSSTALGTGTLTVETPGILLAGAASVTVNNAIILNDSLTIGAAGNTNTLILNGDISGGNDLTILSPVEIPNANPSLTGEVSIQNTMVTIGNELSLGTGQLSTTNATVVLGIPDPTIDNLTGDSTSVISLESEATLTLYTPNPLEQFDGTISGDSSNSVVKTGAGTEYLTGTSTYANGTDISQGTLIAGSAAALGTGTISVNTGAALATANGATLTNNLSLSASSTLGGTGTFAPPGGINLHNGITVNPGNVALGNGTGALAFATGLMFGSSGAYDFNIATASGSAGIDYSTLTVTGGLHITASPVSPFTIYVGSINPSTNQPGLASFNPLVPYSWTLVSADSVTGFSTTKFTIDTSNFQNTFPGGSSLTLVQAGNELVLDFTPVPEPSTWALLLGGVLVVGWGIRRRRQAT